MNINNELKKTKHHLLFIITLPQAIERLYTAFNGSFDSKLHATIDMFIYNIVLLFTYLASAMPFYIFTLTGGSLFRKVLLNTIQSRLPD